MARQPICQLKFDYQPGFFVDYVEIAKNSPCGKAKTQQSFGILNEPFGDASESDRTVLPWERLQAKLARLNEQSPPDVAYKLFFLTRHGFGVHNEAEERVGSKAWNEYWSKLDGDGTVVWADAHLVDRGIQQAAELSKQWARAVAEEKVPIPGTLYTSPLARCLETTRLVFADLLPSSLPSSSSFHAGRGGAHTSFRPIIKEALRERMTDHTCDRRASRTWIAANYPDYAIEDSFVEQDVLWRAERWELNEEHEARKHKVLEDIFATDDNQIVSLTVHSYAISAIFEAVGAPHFRVSEGSTVPLMVKATKAAGPFAAHS